MENRTDKIKHHKTVTIIIMILIVLILVIIVTGKTAII